ncbi:MAG: sulfotransferase family protein [Pseudomonadota bacterium]|nr:sulfotransferase family protein [Pseudomonadota bacterium]
MALKVIGAGFGRTGTDSLREALNLLGAGPCHHMFEVNRDEGQRAAWRALAKGAKPDWEALFQGFSSCVDWPSAFYWRELIEHFPAAKVVLTYRSSEGWWASFEQTILAYIKRVEDRGSLVVTLIADQVFGGRPDDKAHAIAVYEAHVRAVLDAVPADRLHVHRLGDGWPALCAHLGAPIPETPYPSRNSAADIRQAFAAN